jgi:hypothetical protein
VLETIRVFRSGDGGLVFWFGSLVGGGTLVLVGHLGLRSRPGIAFAALLVGAAAGSLATMWTLIIPVLALLLVFLKANELGQAPPAAPESSNQSVS